MDSILPDLEPLAKNRRVIYYDQRGNGRSDLIKDRDKLAVPKHVADLEAVRQFFKLDKMTLIGNSWGGMLISFYAVAHPDRIERMILHNPGEPTRAFAIEAVEEIQSRIDSRYNTEQRKRFAFVSNPQNWVKAKDPRALCCEWAAMLLPTYVSKPENMSNFKGDICSGSEEAVRYQQVVNMKIWETMGDWNLLPQLAVVKAPVLIIHGEDDPIPVESSEAWAQGYPDSRLLLVKDSGHVSHVEQPEIFFKAVETFLKGSFPPDAKRIQSPQERK
jgi:proline iminopeptidase